ncbi:hypothetical protein JYT91_01015 [archaeon AH-315-M20]|nr:hypothetical protein [archaeon AH-315-M20]
MLHKNKRASLELSIRAIVIVVLAMTLLGLGLGFIRSQFGTITSINVEVQEQVKEQITAQLRTSGEKLSFPRNLQMARGERKTLTIGVQNTGSDIMYFGFDVDWDVANSDHVKFDDSTIPVIQNSFEEEYNPRFLADVCSYSLSPSESSAYGVNFKAPKTAGTDMIVLQVKLGKIKDDGSCDKNTDGVGVDSGEIFATKTSFVTIG